MLDNFALLSGQLNTLGKLLRNEKVPPLRNSILLPIALSGDRDPELEVKRFHLILMHGKACTHLVEQNLTEIKSL